MFNHSLLTRIKNSIVVTAVLLSGACATNQPTAGDRATRNGYTIAGYEFLGKGETHQRVLSRYGQPASEATAGTRGQYRILNYPISNSTQHLLVVFCGEEFFGSFREESRKSMDSMIKSHERSTSGRIVLLSAWRDGKTTTFMAEEETLKQLPKWSPGNKAPAPLSESDAEAKAMMWMRTNAPNLVGQPKVLHVIQSPGRPGISYYAVSLGIHNAPPMLHQVLVLMDGSVVSGEIEENN
jgi:hypothetical protein